MKRIEEFIMVFLRRIVGGIYHYRTDLEKEKSKEICERIRELSKLG